MIVFQQLGPDQFPVNLWNTIDQNLCLVWFFEIKLHVVLDQMLENFFLLHVLHVLLLADFSQLDVDVFLLDGLFRVKEFHLLTFFTETNK